MSLAPLPKPARCIASSSHFHVVGISVSETVLDTNLRLDGTPEHRRKQIAVCPKTCEREHLVGHQALIIIIILLLLLLLIIIIIVPSTSQFTCKKKKPLFSPSRPLIKKMTKVTQLRMTSRISRTVFLLFS